VLALPEWLPGNLVVGVYYKHEIETSDSSGIAPAPPSVPSSTPIASPTSEVPEMLRNLATMTAQLMQRMDVQQAEIQQIRLGRPEPGAAKASALRGLAPAGSRSWGEMLRPSLKTHEESSESSDEEVMLPRGGATKPAVGKPSSSAGPRPDDVQTLLQLETLKALCRLRKDNDEDLSEDMSGDEKGPASGLRGVQALRREVERHPARVVRRYE
jgi:hypothetical protein